MEKINIVIIGAGRIGKRHAEHASKFGNLVAVCDNDVVKSNELSNKYNCHSFDSIEKLIKSNISIDIAAICTPNGLHAEHSILLLNNKINVLCEKPMALSASDCYNMILASEQNNKRLFIVKQNRFNPPVLKLKELIDNNSLGNIFSFQLSCFWNRNDEYYDNSWKGSLDLDGGTLYTQFSHFLDLLVWMLGDVIDIEAFGENFNHKNIIEFEDTGVIILKFKNGVIGTVNYTVNSYDKNMEGSLTMFGEKGTMKIGGQYLNEIEYFSIEGLEEIKITKGNKPNNYGKYFGSMSNHGLIYENLVSTLSNQTQINTSSIEGMKTVSTIEKIYEKIRKAN
jgi:predicted dehydrogenase